MVHSGSGLQSTVAAELPDVAAIDVAGRRGISDGIRRLTSGTGFVDCSDRTQIELTGDDRAPFLHNLTTAAIKSLQPGQGCEAFALDVRGHTLGHFLVFCTPHSLIIDSVGGQSERLMAHFERYHIRERIEIHDRTAQWGELLLAGERKSRRDSRIRSSGSMAPAAHIPSDPLSAFARLGLRSTPFGCGTPKLPAAAAC